MYRDASLLRGRVRLRDRRVDLGRIDQSVLVITAGADHIAPRPGTMPFFNSWTDEEPGPRARSAAQWFWRHRANWSPEKWTLNATAFVNGSPIGVQDLESSHFGAVRSVETGSWLGQAYQGQGLGREMREMMAKRARKKEK